MTSQISIVPATAVDLLKVVTRNLIANAKRGQTPAIDLPSLKSRAEHCVKQDTTFPIEDIIPGGG